jgi:hypothetical protein
MDTLALTDRDGTYGAVRLPRLRAAGIRRCWGRARPLPDPVVGTTAVPTRTRSAATTATRSWAGCRECLASADVSTMNGERGRAAGRRCAGCLGDPPVGGVAPGVGFRRLADSLGERWRPAT